MNDITVHGGTGCGTSRRGNISKGPESRLLSSACCMPQKAFPTDSLLTKSSSYLSLKEMGIPDHLTCLLRNLYTGQEATVKTGHGTTDWFQIGKGVHQGCMTSPCLFNLYAEYIMRMLDWRKHKLESRLPEEIAISSDMQMTPPLWQKVKKN